jgi:hypothetical protein
MKFIHYLIPLVLLAACENPDGSIGRPESPIWHSGTPQEIKMEYFTKKCEGFGFQRGTTDMANCLKDTITRSEASANATRAAIASQPVYTPNTPVYQPTYSRNTYTRSPLINNPYLRR